MSTLAHARPCSFVFRAMYCDLPSLVFKGDGGLHGVTVNLELIFVIRDPHFYILRSVEITIAIARKVSVVETTADKAIFPAAACSYGNWQPSAVTIGHYL